MFLADIRKGLFLALSYREYNRYTLSFKAIKNQRSLYYKHVFILILIIAWLNSYIHPHCLAGRKPSSGRGWGGGGAGIGRVSGVGFGRDSGAGFGRD